MKLTYRDKVILAIVLAVAIFAAGFFGLVRPKSQAIKENEATLENLEKEKTEIERKIKRIKKVAANIDDTYLESEDNRAVFVDVDLIGSSNSLTGGTKKLDEYMHDYAEKAKVKITELKTDPTTAAALNYYYKPYVEVAGALRESADINGNLRDKVTKESEDSNYIAARGVENIMSTRYGITIEGKKKDIWNYMSRIEDIDSAVLITSVSLSKAEEQDDDKKATPATPEGQTPQQNNSTSSDQPENWDDDTVLEASIVIQLYSVYQMDKPDTSQDASAE